MRQCLHCGGSIEDAQAHGGCPHCGCQEPFVLRLQGRGRARPRDPELVQLDGLVASWVSDALLHLADRDGWVCHICGLRVPKSCPQGHPASPSRDHVIPRRWERGLSGNVKLAHNWCNSERKDRPMVTIDRLEFRGAMMTRCPLLIHAA